MASWLLEKGAAVNLVQNDGSSALTSSSANGNVEIFGAQIDVCSKGDLSTAWYAAIQNKSKALKVLLENGAQVDLLFNRNGFSPLISAKLDTLVVDVLLGCGAIKYQLAG